MVRPRERDAAPDPNKVLGQVGQDYIALRPKRLDSVREYEGPPKETVATAGLGKHRWDAAARADGQVQLEQLRQRGESVGSERIEEVQREWADLFARFREAMEAGADPASQEMKELARKSESLIAEFTGGDPGITASLTNMYAEQGGPKVLETQEMDVDRDLWEYMGKAKAALAST